MIVQVALESVSATHQLNSAVHTLALCIRPLLLTGFAASPESAESGPVDAAEHKVCSHTLHRQMHTCTCHVWAHRLGRRAAATLRCTLLLACTFAFAQRKYCVDWGLVSSCADGFVSTELQIDS